MWVVSNKLHRWVGVILPLIRICFQSDRNDFCLHCVIVCVVPLLRFPLVFQHMWKYNSVGRWGANKMKVHKAFVKCMEQNSAKDYPILQEIKTIHAAAISTYATALIFRAHKQFPDTNNKKEATSLRTTCAGITKFITEADPKVSRDVVLIPEVCARLDGVAAFRF